ncbi:hypothetical protein [Flavobacterium tegetincola]|uniref:hypothetical protein n=1 Tax=Flavobacterium tegetincola TaxID=150172 RepID=UPI0012FA4EDC|nr:hypothetical protein [Flavobacterium tegetincola]
MKRLKVLLKVALLSCTFLLFVNCDTDDVPQDSQAHQHEDSNKISFNDFIKKTKIKKFDVNIKPVAVESDVLGRSSEDLQFIGFTVDTLTVKQLVKNGETTFTLPVIPNPYPNNPNFYYNIVFHQVGEAYQWSILEFEKTEENVEVTELLNETTNNGMVDVGARIDVIWKMKILFHCTKTGLCADGPCDSCEQCISLGTVVSGVDEKEFLSITDTPQNLISQNGGGLTSGNSFSPVVIAAINNFTSTLTTAQLAVYNANKSSFDNYLRNNSSTLVGSLGQQSTLIYPSAQQFLLNLFNLGITNNLTFVVGTSASPSNVLHFNNVQEFQNFLNTNQNSVGTDFELLQQVNEKLASTKFGYGTYSIKAEIKQETAPSYKVVSVNSYITGITFLLSWDQTNFVTSHSGSTATIDLYGKLTYGVTIGTFNGLSVTVDLHYQLATDKPTGNIISAIQLP